MRKKKDYTTASITKEVHTMLKEDRDEFQKTIGGGSWSISDTIEEYKKIINHLKQK